MVSRFARLLWSTLRYAENVGLQFLSLRQCFHESNSLIREALGELSAKDARFAIDLWTGSVMSVTRTVLSLPYFSEPLDFACLVRKPEVPAPQVFPVHELSREFEVRSLPKSTRENELRRGDKRSG
jgi:hypothetical protein